MKFNTKLKLEKIVSQDEARFSLNRIYHDKAASKIVATDGHRLVALPVTENEHDDAGFISKDAFVAARKAKPVGDAPALTIVGEKLSIPSAAQTFDCSADGMTFPEYQRVLPNFAIGDRNVATITLNAKYLLEIAQALGGQNDQVQISFKLDEAHGPLSIVAGTDGGVAVLMPIRNACNEVDNGRGSKITHRVNPTTNEHIINYDGTVKRDSEAA